MEIPGDGVYYIALGEHGLNVFNNPTQDEHFILILNRGAPFIIHEGVATAVEAAKGYDQHGLKVSITMETHLPPQVERMFSLIKERLSIIPPKFLAAGAVALTLVVILGFAIFGGSNDMTRSEVIDVSQAVVDEQGQLEELIEMRYKLAKQALEQQRPEKALEIIAKILKLNTNYKPAWALKEKADAMLKARKTKSRDVLARDIWVQRVLTNATELMSQGDYMGAKFELQQILNADPNHAAALDMARRIDKRMSDDKVKLVSDEEQRIAASALAEKNFKAAKGLLAQGKRTEAYYKLKEAVDTLNKYSLHPDFEVDLMELYNESRSQAKGRADAMYSSASDLYGQGKSAKSIEIRSKYFRSALGKIEELNKLYNIPGSDDLKTKIHTDLNETLKPIFEEAVTLQELEGCCYANPRFKRITRLAQYPDVEYYKRAESAMARCPCKK
jgi:tetratricopeptide (TPR) repeat protein